jgi:uncharacterized protein YPO0396
MTASSIATVVVFASVGLIALALALIARRYSASAFATGLVGLLALTTASTWITYAGEEIDVQVIDSLKAEIAARNKELQSSREQIQELQKRVEAGHQIRTNLATAQARLAEAQQEADRAKAEARRLIGELQDEQAERANAESNKAVGIAKVAELEKKLSDAIAQQPPPSPPQPGGTPNDPGDLRRQLANRLDTP